MELLQGTAGWSELIFPSSVQKDTKARLEYYARHWPCVEVNTSCYAIPSPSTTGQWATAVATTAPDFLFHFKAFGLFCSKGAPLGQIPGHIRPLLGSLQYSSYVSLVDMPPAALDACWQQFNAALEPVYQKSLLGVTTFQFHLNFRPSDANLSYVVECRSRLDARFSMAVEFRCREWFTEDCWQLKTSEALKKHGIAWVAADELEHETYQKEKEQRGLLPGQSPRLLPICMDMTCREFFYVRLHRRTGDEERKLSQHEIDAWKERLVGLEAKGFKGKVYFIWGTDYKDVPYRNAADLDRAVPERMRVLWKNKIREKPGSIMAMFNSGKKRKVTNVMETKRKEKKSIEEWY